MTSFHTHAREHSMALDSLITIMVRCLAYEGVKTVRQEES